jgi:hypothetical protein
LNGMGGCRFHSLSFDRKSGMPHSVEMPAPVKATTRFAPSINRESFRVSSSIDIQLTPAFDAFEDRIRRRYERLQRRNVKIA